MSLVSARQPKACATWADELDMTSRCRLLLAIAVVTLSVFPAAAQSSTNGVYGGYVGSDRWFADMRRTPASPSSSVPPDYVEASGLIVFPEGNPFPRKRLPDVRIQARDQIADPVDRAPYVYDPGNFFYTVLKKGLQYDISWMYYFGDRERFATVYVEPSGPAQRSYVFEYRHSSATISAPAPVRLAPLASGSTVQVSLDAATGLAGVLSPTQYIVDAPAGTTKLALSANTTLDANLYVRRSSPVAVQEGHAVYDYVFTPNPTQSRFEISPVPAGAWYIAVGNYSTNPGTVSLTANVESGPPGPQISSSGVVHGASFEAGALAPGEIVTLFGSGLGPSALTSLRLNSAGLVPTSLADTRVLLDGVAAPLLYVSEKQSSFLVPYAVAGRTTTQLQVEYRGVSSAVLTLRVAASAPGLFTLDSSGRSQAAALNQDGGVNSASKPAARDSVVTLFATGEGDTTPPGVDGKLAADPLPAPRLPVSVTIGGQPAAVLYAGGAPGLVAGVLQVNVRVPDGVTPGPAVAVVVTVGSASSQSGVTLAVR